MAPVRAEERRRQQPAMGSMAGMMGGRSRRADRASATVTRRDGRRQLAAARVGYISGASERVDRGGDSRKMVMDI
jgi:hypothetical protein